MEQLKLWGSIVNALAVIGGSAIGLLLKRFIGAGKEERSQALSDCIFKGVALCVLAIGITGTIKAAVNDQIRAAIAGGYAGDTSNPIRLVADLAGENTLVIIVSMALGALIGQLLNLDRAINRLGERVEQLARARFGNVAQGFVSASLLFCVGSMTIVGSLNSGLLGDHSMLYTKSLLDFVAAIIFSLSLGIGVMFSSAFVLVFQGSIALLAGIIAPILSTEVITAMSGVGSILIIGLSLNMLGVTKLKIMNYMPAILLPALLIPLIGFFT
ncbi:MAG: DUF554 domain-containing protein [Ruminococcaceae bacterium]|nr:DUF554 domain-containing protein [Oscillospiraceae bacterium]